MSEHLRIVIVEDEPVIARELAYMLRSIDQQVLIVQTLASVQEAIIWFENNAASYELILMDIRLSDGRSFDIFKKVTIIRPVIFVTSYDEYALEAFKSNGLDYILKPFDSAELKAALLKYRNWTSAGHGDTQFIDVQQLLASMQLLARSYRKSFLVYVKNKLIPIEVDQIAWFYTADEFVYAQTSDNRNFVIDQTMEQLSQQLNPVLFFRANRQFIIQRKSISEVDFFFNGRLHLKVDPLTPERILVSKARVAEFKKWMNS
jgi:two-component system response regulator LytT